MARATFRHGLRARFYEADPAGVLFYGRLFELFHEAYAALLEAAGVEYTAYFGLEEFAAPVVHAEADYRAPIRPGDDLSLEVTVTRLGRTSITVAYAVHGGGGELKATGTETHVIVDRGGFKSMPLPSWLREALEPYLA
ncbi:MAG: acyl-CoA thioesterase [Anaerolineae bacterium]